MKNENKVLACVDKSHYADYVADYAAWAAKRLDAPLEFLHVIDNYPSESLGEDRSGAIGIDANENLLKKLTAEGEAHIKAAREQGRIFLNRLRERAIEAGAKEVDTRQRHGDLQETIAEQGADVRLLVLGRRGETPETSRFPIGRHVERVVRSLNRPILAVTENFKEPQRVMIAFDGGNITRRGVKMIADSPLFKGLPITLLMSGKEKPDGQKQLDWAKNTLEKAGFEVKALLTPGDTSTVIAQVIKEQSIDMLIMGAFSRSPLHGWIFGSNTLDLLRAATIPTLLLR